MSSGRSAERIGADPDAGASDGVEVEHGLAPGDHVSVVARNHVEYLVAIVGTQRAGMVVTPVKTGLRQASR